ncbi:hypothetical protein ID866_4618 [Astraeus odoratus]|nr:hypothetical protein ID866_4618 [Astraeus odoratus]
MSHVARLSVVTKTKADSCAWKAYYSDGVLVPPKQGQTPDPKPCAGNDGTTITIEDMFYNTPTRLSALRSPSEEYAKILDVITKYAVHNSKISFLCKKAGSPSPEISTAPVSDVSQAIRLLYGHAIAKELLHVEIAPEKAKDDVDDPERWSAEAYCTSANYQGKKTNLLLFINHRLVESTAIKRAVESVYSGVLPKGAFPFVYLSLEMDPRAVDVNVHPTKREVLFLNEEAVIERISDSIQQHVVGQSQSRVFEYQTLLPGVSVDPAPKKGKKRERDKETEIEGEEEESEDEDRPTTIQKTLSQHKVRTSLQDRTLESMLPMTNPARSDGDDPSGTAIRLRDIKESQCDLTSIMELRQSVISSIHYDLTEIIRRHTFVGVVDNIRCLSLIQHQTKLYLINHAALAEEMFYQLALMQFGDCKRLRLDPPPPLLTLLKLAVDGESGTERSGLNKEVIVERIAKTLVDRREMLKEYFALDISESGDILTLPHLLKEYTPDLNKLPTFLMRLGPQVRWLSLEKIPMLIISIR